MRAEMSETNDSRAARCCDSLYKRALSNAPLNCSDNAMARFVSSCVQASAISFFFKRIAPIERPRTLTGTVMVRLSLPMMMSPVSKAFAIFGSRVSVVICVVEGGVAR